jgi:hypothetical protein
MDNIAILITTFLRDSLLYKTLQTIVDNHTNDCIVLIADQGYNSSDKDVQIDYYKSQIKLEYYKLPFDCGLSYSRNYLISKAKELNIPYILMCADSIQFSQSYNFEPIIKTLKSDAQLGIIGFALEHSKCPWEFNMEVTPTGIKMLSSSNYTEFEGIKYKKVDICRNIFLAKTDTMLNLYDNEMKLMEHEIAFLEYKKRGYKVYWTDSISFKKVTTITSDEYQNYRKRLSDYRPLFEQKLGIKGWVKYAPEAMREIKEYKEKYKC